GFMPASGVRGSHRAAFPPPSAGINPAPQHTQCIGTAGWFPPAPCGAGFMPASGVRGSHRAAFPPPSAGINPAPQHSTAQHSTQQCIGTAGWLPPAPLWDRLYAGQRSEGLAPGGVPTAVGRDKPGPTTHTVHWHGRMAPSRPLWPRLYAGPRSEGLAPGRVPTAVGRDKPGPTTHTVHWHGRMAPSRPLWGRLYAGQRSEGLAPGRVPTAVGRDKPGPTTQHSTAQQCMGTAVWLPPAPLWGRLYAG